MKKYLLILSAALLLFAASCSRKTNTHIENPIILVSGYGSKVSLWENSGFVSYLEEQGLEYGGRILKKNATEVQAQQKLKGKIDFFSLAYSDSTTNVETLSKELDLAIKYVLDYTQSDKVMLIAYSMGGLVCRKYLADNYDDHKVQTLISISSPHKGSFLANFAQSTTQILSEKAREKYIQMVSEYFEIDIDGEALHDLRIENEENFLEKLNQSPHPSDINYISIIGLLNSEDTSLFTNLFSKFYSGDLVCSESSQNMANIEWFEKNPPLFFRSEKIYGVHHLNILEQSDKLYEIIKDFIFTKD